MFNWKIMKLFLFGKAFKHLIIFLLKKQVNNVIGVIFDIEALGTYKSKEWTANTPLNAAGGYINYYWHLKDMYFNDLSENLVSFVIA